MKKSVMNRSFLLILLTGTLVNHLDAQEVMHVQNGAILTVQAGASLTVAGSVALDNGSQLLHNGTITLLNNSTAGISNWSDLTILPYAYGNGLWIFNSTGDQSLLSSNIFGTLKVQNRSLSLNSDLRSNNIILAQGPINANVHQVFVTAEADTALRADPSNFNFINSWINGTVKRNINTTLFNRYDFPTGVSNRNNRVVLDNLKAHALTGVSSMVVSFGPKAGSDVGLAVSENGAAYISVNNGGVWHINPNVAPTGGAYDLQLFFTGFTALADGQFGILQRPEISSNAADWTVPVGSSQPILGAPGRTVASGFVQRNSIPTFGQFGIGASGIDLPILLTAFNARRTDKNAVDLTWQTGTEQNNKGFGIERRQDNETAYTERNFVGSLAAGGNSVSTLDYQYADLNDYTGTSFYRLRQEDLDGKFTYSIVKAVSGLSSNTVTISLFPNPGQGQFNIRIDGTTKKYKALITDQLGRTVRTLEVTGNNTVLVTSLSAGMYFVTIPDVFGNGHSFTEKILVVH